ncbi:hypothetical protein LTR05_000088 [Lithohypha guttulata]|uniref:Glutamyl-tRNA synthetase n=1 Tax=Lithohypha guttulata TaxID=1690604 RepID=A0AAN7T7I7_9EURO|nr:hypothetical protein LTR05_000088 [Lithohypha guttulata]
MTPNIERAIELIDEAHAQDPRKTESNEPYELHYAQRMTHYLDLHTPDASPLLRTAVRAQHFRRWEVPRDTYPKTKPGYFAWRTFLKKRQAQQVKEICLQCDFTEDEASKVAALIAKEELKKGEGRGDAEAQVLEDCACLVFLDDQFDHYETKWKVEHDSEEDADKKMVAILQKTWVKMGKRGQELALQLDLSEKAKELVGQALAQQPSPTAQENV